MNELSRYLDKYIDFDALGERIDQLQERLGRLREHLPDTSVAKLRGRLPSYREVRGKLPYAPRPRNYTLPALLAVGSIAIIGAVVVTAVVMSDTNKRVPKSNEDMT
jgi:hypothetical protein